MASPSARYRCPRRASATFKTADSCLPPPPPDPGHVPRSRSSCAANTTWPPPGLRSARPRHSAAHPQDLFPGAPPARHVALPCPPARRADARGHQLVGSPVECRATPPPAGAARRTLGGFAALADCGGLPASSTPAAVIAGRFAMKPGRPGLRHSLTGPRRPPLSSPSSSAFSPPTEDRGYARPRRG